MPINEKLIIQEAAASTGDADAAEGLVLHLDANDEDSIESGGANQGNGSGTWFDIANHDLNVPLIDKGSNLVLHLNASDTNSYGGSGNTWTDLSTYGNDGAISNTGGTNNATFESDTRGYFDFEASDGNDNVEITDSSSLDIATNITLEAWINEESVFNYGRLIWKNGAYALYRGTNGWNFLTGSDILVHNSDIPSTSTWYHIAATYDGANKKLYINGTLVDTESETGSIPTNNNSLFIGGDGTANRFFDGKVSSVRIYDVALTASEVAQNYRANSFLSYSSIYDTNLQLHLDAGDETTVSASTWSDKANSFDGTFTNFSSTLTDFYDKELGNFISFDGSNDHIKINNTGLTKSDGVNFTVEAWVNQSGNIDYIASNTSDDGNDQNWLLRFQSNQVKWFVYGSNSFLSTSSTFSANTWNHIAAVVESDGTQIIYVNGKEEANAGSGQSANTNSYNTFIGSLGNQATTNAEIGQVRIYHTGLTSAQVAQNYLATKNDYPNGHNGDIQGPTFQGGSTPYYFDFDGTNDYLEIPASTSLDIGSGGFTYETWLLNEKSSGTSSVISNLHNVSGYTGYTLRINNGTDVNLFIYNNTAVIFDQTASSSVTTNTWTHLAFTVASASSGAAVKLYINGILSSVSGTLSGAYGGSGQNIQAGQYPFAASGRYFEGRIGLAKVFQKELSASELLAEFNATKATFGIS